MRRAIDIGSRRELFVDRFLVEALDGVAFTLHAPQPAPPMTVHFSGHYMTVLKDEDIYRAYYRQVDPSYTGNQHDGHQGELTCCAESRNGIDWQLPELGICDVGGSRRNNVVLRQSPFSHNFAPFVDFNPTADPSARYKALAGTHTSEMGHNGLHAFHSPDGRRWEMLHEKAVVTSQGFAFDSQNVSFWSPAERQYVCYYRSWDPKIQLRSISRTTSPDFLHWTEAVPMNPNLPGEHLYTSQTHPYFRAPHIYVALPTRFLPDRGSSTDILFMITRAGSVQYERLFTEAFITPGPDPRRWGNRSNYAACGVVPTGPAEMSIYHGPAGQRYTLRTDGFTSLRAGFAGGTMTTRPFTFAGEELTINVATSAGGSVRIELRDEAGKPLPGRSLAEADEIVGDAVEHRVTWKGDGDVSAWAGRPVRLHIAMREADLYSLAFSPSYYGPAAPALKRYFAALQPVVSHLRHGDGASRLELLYTRELVDAMGPAVEQAQAAVRDQPPYAERLAPIVAGYEAARRSREAMDRLPLLRPDEAARCLDDLEQSVLRFDPAAVFARGPGLYPPSPQRWEAFRREQTEQASLIAGAFVDSRIAQDLDRQWHFQTDPGDAGLGNGWMNVGFDSSRWAVLNADRCWQEQGYPDYHGVAWYRRAFDAPAVEHGRKLVLYFGAVDGDATVFLDGRKIGEHLLGPDGAGWNTPFHFDITGHAVPGRPILIAVRVKKDVYAGGIFKGVKLLDVRGERTP